MSTQLQSLVHLDSCVARGRSVVAEQKGAGAVADGWAGGPHARGVRQQACDVKAIVRPTHVPAQQQQQQACEMEAEEAHTELPNRQHVLTATTLELHRNCRSCLAERKARTGAYSASHLGLWSVRKVIVTSSSSPPI